MKLSSDLCKQLFSRDQIVKYAVGAAYTSEVLTQAAGRWDGDYKAEVYKNTEKILVMVGLILGVPEVVTAESVSEDDMPKSDKEMGEFMRVTAAVLRTFGEHLEDIMREDLTDDQVETILERFSIEEIAAIIEPIAGMIDNGAEVHETGNFHNQD